MTIDCGICRSRLKAWLDGELPPSLGPLVAEHVASCESCREAASDFRKISGAIRSLSYEPVPQVRPAEILRRARDAAGEDGRIIRTLQRVAAMAAGVVIVAGSLALWSALSDARDASASAGRDNVLEIALSDPTWGEEF